LFARYIPEFVEEDCAGAIQHFERAIDLDPNFRLAYGGLGAAYVNRVFKGFGGSKTTNGPRKRFGKRSLLTAIFSKQGC
jgi:hypothetical protein